MFISRRDLIVKGTLALPTAGLLTKNAAASLADQADSSRNANVEARGVWLHTSSFDEDPVKGKEQIRDAVQKFVDVHLNLVLPWVTTGYLVALENVDYQKKYPTARWDALGCLIQEATQHGLAVHLWYPITEYRTANSPDFDPKVGGNPKWAARRIDQLVPNYPIAKGAGLKAQLMQQPQWLMDAIKVPLPAQSKGNVCPQHAGARAWQLQLLAKALDRYPELGGIHVEEAGYSYPGNCVCDLCQTVFQQLYEKPLADHLISLEAQDFRCPGASAFMAELYRMIRERNPKLQFSTTGTPDWRWDQSMLGRNWQHWATKGWLDYYVPQDYDPSPDNFRQRLSSTMKCLKQECPVYAGIGITWSARRSEVSPPVIVREIELARELGAGGILLFPAEKIDNKIQRGLLTGEYLQHTTAIRSIFDDELKTALLEGPFRLPAKLPWIDHALPPAGK